MSATSSRHLVAGDGVDKAVVGGQVQAVPLGLVQHRRPPDDSAGHVTTEDRVQDAVIRPLVREAAEDPGRNRDDVAVGADVLALLAVDTPAQPELAAEVDEDLGGEMQVQVVGDAARHTGGTGVEPVVLGEVDDLRGFCDTPDPMKA